MNAHFTTPAEDGIRAAQQENIIALLEVGDLIEVTFPERDDFVVCPDYDTRYQEGPHTLRGEILWTDGHLFVVADLDVPENVGFSFEIEEGVTIRKIEAVEEEEK